MDNQRPDSAPSASHSLSTAIHEINNPLEALTNLVYLIQQDASLSEQTRAHLQMAERELRRISKIAQDAMREARDEEMVETDIAELLTSVLELYHAQCAAKKISVETRSSPGSRISVRPGKIRQVFTNLLLNAIEAMPDGGRLCARSASAQERSGKLRKGLRVTFADNGHGIAPKDLPRIFEPRFTTKGEGGQGMGLSVVQDIVNRHRGGLKVRSCVRAGRNGTVFSIFLPSKLGHA